jgi:hypothetical protein
LLQQAEVCDGCPIIKVPSNNGGSAAKEVKEDRSAKEEADRKAKEADRKAKEASQQTVDKLKEEGDDDVILWEQEEVNRDAKEAPCLCGKMSMFLQQQS